MDDLRISVVIPTYNRAPLIRRAVESALTQTRSPFEVIVVDDGSTDETPREVGELGTRVRYVRQANAGASAARNRGVEESRAPWVAFLDSDDLWNDTHLERISRALDATGGGARFYFSDMEMSPEEGGGTLWERIGFRIAGEHERVPDATAWVVLERQPTMLQSCVVERAAYLACGGLDTRFRLIHDTHLFLKMGLGQPACAVAGCGTRQTADDTAGTRLTAIHTSATRGYWEESRNMWQDLLRAFPVVPAPHRRTLRGYLAMAHWRLARLAWKEHRPVEAFRETGCSFTIEPRTFLGILGRPMLRSPRGGAADASHPA
jgi:glycosyltransferase involved in cell wall biosynthesis